MDEYIDGTTETLGIPATEIPPTFVLDGTEIDSVVYEGPVSYLQFEYIGNSSNEVIIGSYGNEFFSLGDGDDAVRAGSGADVIDGGAGSNFLAGGIGKDTFFLDGRGAETTWSTISDFSDEEGDQVNIWGWVDGVSQLVNTEESAGAEGYEGVTNHYDLDNDGTVDTSITFTGLNSDNIPTASVEMVEGRAYLYFA